MHNSTHRYILVSVAVVAAAATVYVFFEISRVAGNPPGRSQSPATLIIDPQEVVSDKRVDASRGRNRASFDGVQARVRELVQSGSLVDIPNIAGLEELVLTVLRTYFTGTHKDYEEFVRSQGGNMGPDYSELDEAKREYRWRVMTCAIHAGELDRNGRPCPTEIEPESGITVGRLEKDSDPTEHLVECVVRIIIQDWNGNTVPGRIGIRFAFHKSSQRWTLWQQTWYDIPNGFEVINLPI
jgi:hypothetical protein